MTKFKLVALALAGASILFGVQFLLLAPGTQPELNGSGPQSNAEQNESGAPTQTASEKQGDMKTSTTGRIAQLKRDLTAKRPDGKEATAAEAAMQKLTRRIEELEAKEDKTEKNLKELNDRRGEERLTVRARIWLATVILTTVWCIFLVAFVLWPCLRKNPATSTN